MGDKKYPQQPNEDVSTEEQLKIFEKMLKEYTPVDYTRLQENDDETHLTETVVCAGGQCEKV
jgi:hypothetical protein